MMRRNLTDKASPICSFAASTPVGVWPWFRAAWLSLALLATPELPNQGIAASSLIGPEASELRGSPTDTPGEAPWLEYDVTGIYPHDRTAFTQGLLFHEGYLYESTGLVGQSCLRQVEIETGRVLREVAVPTPHFAEGLAELGGRLFQLTWKSQLGFIYDITTLRQVGTFRYTGEGWGLTQVGGRLLMSNGSSTLRLLDPVTLSTTGHIEVREGNQAQGRLNELELIRGKIFANLWLTDTLVVIDPASGRITGRLNLQGLLTADDRREPVDLLNGIAYDEARDRIFVTGKWWPKLFEIRLRSP